MSTVHEIERAIESLNPKELEGLYAWLEQHYSQSLDSRLASDLAAGRLDTGIKHALDDEKHGRDLPL